MGILNPDKIKFLHHLKKGFGYGEDLWISEEKIISHSQITRALKALSTHDKSSWQILHFWMTTNLDMEGLALKHNWPSHTIRRRLYACVDVLMNWVQTESYAPTDNQYSTMSECELFHKSLLSAIEKYNPDLFKEVKKSFKIANSLRRKENRRGKS
jgi:hypothetical protein